MKILLTSVILLYNSVIKSSNVVQSAEFFSTLGLKLVSSPFLVPFFLIHVLYPCILMSSLFVN